MLKTSVHAGVNPTGLSDILRARVTTVKFCDWFPTVVLPAGDRKLDVPVGDALTIGRTTKEIGFRRYIDSPASAARGYVEQSLDPVIFANPNIAAWECLNEPNPDGWDEPNAPIQMAWYGAFLYHCAKELYWRGKIAVLGNWSTGCPPRRDLLEQLSEMLQATVDFPGTLLGQHAYGGIFMKGPSGELIPDTFTTFRYRDHAQVYARMGYPGVKFVLTECGLDRTGNEKVGFTHAWRSPKPLNDYWQKIGIDFRYDNFDDYWRYWIREFELEIRRDPYVVGANLFTLGLRGWDDFQLPGLELARRMQTLSNELGDIEKDIKMTVQIVNVPIPIPVNAQFNFAPLAKVIIDASNDLNQHGQVGTYIPFGQPVPPVPGLTWPNLTALNQDIINHVTVRGALLPLSAIPTAILSEMTTPSENRQKTYGSLNSKLPLEQWKLSPTDFDKVVAAFKAAGIL